MNGEPEIVRFRGGKKEQIDITSGIYYLPLASLT
jgi:hypothetical protein